MSRSTRHGLLIALLIAAAVAAFLWWKQPEPAVQRTEAPVAPAPPLAVPTPGNGDSPTAQAALEPAIRHPLEMPAATPPLAAGDIGSVLAALLGRQAVTTFFQLDDFPRRFVATVDNLGRSHAPPMLWPIHPTPERFTVETREGEAVIGADNSQRYTPLVLLAESFSPAQAVDLYLRAYPLLQRAYEDLGYPKRYFNDRLIEVIDQLLATPEVRYPVKVQLTEVKGPVPSVRPWVRYEFVDPALEALPAGQKMLLRTGPVNERRLKARLLGIRDELLRRAPPR